MDVDGSRHRRRAELLSETLRTSATTPAAGRILAIADFEAVTLTCNSGNGAISLYVDGQVVPHTAAGVQNAAVESYRAIGVTANVLPAGQHSVAIGGVCTSGFPISLTGSNESLLAGVLLGQ